MTRDGASLESPSPAAGTGHDPLIGSLLAGRYRIESVLGTGGVGVVYRAEHVALRRAVALKVLNQDFAHRDDLRIRFEREAKALSHLAHPHVVAINDFGTADGTTYLVMELLEGRTLQEHLAARGRLEPEEAIEIARGILRGLAFAHGRGLLHRDLKPGNVFLQALPDDPAHVKLLDFGLAKAIDDGASEGEAPLTRLGTVLGTPAYMSPEQASGASTDARTDVYSAGVVLFELLTGRTPFTGETRAELMRAHMLAEVPDLAAVRSDLRPSGPLVALVRRALAKEPRHRFVDAAEMLVALDALPRPAATLVAPLREPLLALPTGDAETMLAGGGPRRSAESTRKSKIMVETEPSSRDDDEGSAPLVISIVAFLALLTLGAALATNFFGLGSGSAAPSSEAVVPPSAPTETGAVGTNAAREAETKLEPAPSAEVVEKDVEPVAVEPSPAAEPRAVARPAARNLLAGNVPRELRAIRARVYQGDPLSKAQMKALRRFQQKKPNDVQAMLLLAHDFVHRNWLSDAVARYETAYRLDGSSRGDPRMLRYLVKIASTDAAGAKAAEAIVTIYGSEALSAVDRAIESAEDASTKARLTSLRAGLVSAP